MRKTKALSLFMAILLMGQGLPVYADHSDSDIMISSAEEQAEEIELILSDDPENEIVLSDESVPKEETAEEQAQLLLTEETNSGEIIASGTFGQNGELTWTFSYIGEDYRGVLTISGTGDMPEFDYDNPPWVDFNYDITYLVIEEGVTSICENAFFQSNIERIKLPETLVSIGDWAFSWCFNLISVDIPDSVTKIGRDAFTGCESLAEITLGTEFNGSVNDIFSLCPSIESITVDEQNLQYSSIDGVLFNKAQDRLLRYPPKKEGKPYIVPDTVVRFDSDAFEACTRLQEFAVGENNTNFSSLDGVLFDKEQTRLVRYPCGKKDWSYVIPESVETIASSAFENCVNLNEITFSQNIQISY